MKDQNFSNSSGESSLKPQDGEEENNSSSSKKSNANEE